MMGRGRRESHWLVIRRCLAIIRRVQCGLADRDALLKAVLAAEGPEAYGGVQGELVHRRLEEDRKRIRENLRIDLEFDRRLGGYVIRDHQLPLLDLPDKNLATIAWLEQVFDHDSPQHDEVHDLLSRLRLYLSIERRAEIERCRTTLNVDLGQRDEDEIASPVWEGLTKALLERRQVELVYLSPKYEDGQPRRYVVNPYERYFDTTRGHYYLYGYCHYAVGPDGQEARERYTAYRLGRIRELSVLPQKLPPVRPLAPRYEVEYELVASVARLGITRHPRIEVRETEKREDGRVVVRGETDSLFWAVRTLLHYGPNCRVLGGPEMMREMQAVVQEMAQQYGASRER